MDRPSVSSGVATRIQGAYWRQSLFRSVTAQTPPTLGEEGVEVFVQMPGPLLVDDFNTAFASPLYLANAEEERAKLLNLGNACFANAAAQVLLWLEPFWNSLRRLHLASFGFTLAGHRDACECLYRQVVALRGLEPGSRKKGTSFVSEGVGHGIFGEEFTAI